MPALRGQEGDFTQTQRACLAPAVGRSRADVVSNDVTVGIRRSPARPSVLSTADAAQVSSGRVGCKLAVAVSWTTGTASRNIELAIVLAGCAGRGAADASCQASGPWGGRATTKLAVVAVRATGRARVTTKLAVAAGRATGRVRATTKLAVIPGARIGIVVAELPIVATVRRAGRLASPSGSTGASPGVTRGAHTMATRDGRCGRVSREHKPSGLVGMRVSPGIGAVSAEGGRVILRVGAALVGKGRAVGTRRLCNRGMAGVFGGGVRQGARCRRSGLAVAPDSGPRRQRRLSQVPRVSQPSPLRLKLATLERFFHLCGPTACVCP
mmetsp:Transcript_22012/g.83752  ORF Transcript_22012/g.83752 Transcript_22012/m.83752 type:complete len:326 (-) Transcript_22012:658-1635(-)